MKNKFCASSWLITKINILRCTVSKTSKFVAKVSFSHFSDLSLNFKTAGVLTTAENHKFCLIQYEINVRDTVTYMVRAYLHIWHKYISLQNRNTRAYKQILIVLSQPVDIIETYFNKERAESSTWMLFPQSACIDPVCS